MLATLIRLVIDSAIVALFLVSGYIYAVGGFVLHISDLDIRFRSPARTLLWLGVAVIVRVVVYRHAPFFGRTSAEWRRLLLASPGADPFRLEAPRGFWLRTLFASLGIAAAIAIVMHHVVLHPYSVPDYGDPLFSIWRMGWVQHQIVSDPAHLFDANIFHPEPLTLTLSDPIILPALMEAPLVAMGVPHVVAYNVLFFFVIWGSGVATYLLVERLTGSPASAFVAGVVFACSPYRVDHVSHLELQMTQWMPLGLLALHSFVSTGRFVYAVALGLTVAAQLYSSMYYGVFFVIFAAVVGIGLILVHRPPVRRMLVPLAAAAVLAGVLAAPLARAFVAAQPLKGDRSLKEIASFSAEVSDYIRPPAFSRWWDDRLPKSTPERALFPGAAPLVLAAIGLAPPVSAIRLVYAAALLLSVDASRGLNAATYPILHRWVPGMRGLRVPARFGIVVGLVLAIFAGFGARRLLGCVRRRAIRHAMLLVLTAGVVVDAFAQLDGVVPVWTEPPAFYEQLKGKSGVVLAEMPVTPTQYFNAAFMYFSLWHWRPMVNGYSGFQPKSYDALLPHLIEFPRGTSASVLRDRGVTHVTVNCGLRYPNCEETAGLMRASKDLRLIAETRWEGAPVQLYELIPR